MNLITLIIPWLFPQLHQYVDIFMGGGEITM